MQKLAENSGDCMCVLVIEDEPDLLSVLAQSLREYGYAVDTAADGIDGLFKAERCQYDALILDLMITQLDGRAVIETLRSAGNAIPVLVLTARDALPDSVRGLDYGADEYLTKPFDLADLFARLRAVIRRSAGKLSSIAQIVDVQIDTIRKCVSKAGQLVSLTPREYALVEFLALHRGQLVTRSMLYEHLFDEDNDSLSNLVDVHVSNVRNKLGKDFILTWRGQGYLLEEGTSASDKGRADV
jgi:two-component system, OmpR family, response regulator